MQTCSTDGVTTIYQILGCNCRQAEAAITRIFRGYLFFSLYVRVKCPFNLLEHVVKPYPCLHAYLHPTSTSANILDEEYS